MIDSLEGLQVYEAIAQEQASILSLSLYLNPSHPPSPVETPNLSHVERQLCKQKTPQVLLLVDIQPDFKNY